MKKLILILTLIFTLALCFVACEELGDNSDEGQSQNVILNGAPTSEEPTSEEPTSEKLYQELNIDDEHDRKLRQALIGFLGYKLGYDEPLESILEAQISRNLYRGDKVTHVQFNPLDFYYVCGYYNCEHTDESEDYYCKDKYTWIIVQNEKNIPDKYNGLSFVVAFQINKTSSAINVATNEPVATAVEHYMQYMPEFENGLNIADAISFDSTYICFTDPDDKYMFDCSKEYHHFTYTLSCVELDEKWYVQVENDNLEVEFGQYYDVLIEIAEEYDNYVILEFNAFAEAVLK